MALAFKVPASGLYSSILALVVISCLYQELCSSVSWKLIKTHVTDDTSWLAVKGKEDQANVLHTERSVG